MDKTIGYIVIDANTLGGILGYDDEQDGVLFLDAPATLFSSKKKAQAAVRRSVKYWDDSKDNYEIVRVSAVTVPKR